MILKRYLYLLSTASTAVPLMSLGLYLLLNGAMWTLLIPVCFIFIFVPVMDTIIGEDNTNVTDISNDSYYHYVLITAITTCWASYIATVAFVGTQHLPLWAWTALAIGVGTNSGSCLVIGHELGHRVDRMSKVLALVANAIVGYGHFRIEHNRGHHVRVATPEDPASAKYGESIYQFAVREIPGAFMGAWRSEAIRLTRCRESAFTIHNEILQGYCLTFCVAFCLAIIFGWIVLPFIIVHHLIGWYGLTQANYVEHYGLLRTKLPSGRYEIVQPRHSWNTNHLLSNALSFHLQRHSDHHANPMRPYQSLRNFPDLPRLPNGYPGMFLLASIPPLWFRVMNPKVLAWAGGDKSKINMIS